MKKMSRALSAYRTKSHLVYEALRQAILSGRFQPGARVNIDQLALEFGTSKVPVREAVVRLVGEGWLRTQPHVGPIVPELSSDEILETSILRSVVEGAAVRFSAGRLSKDSIAKLGVLVARMDEAVATRDTEFPQLNLEFHVIAIGACPFPSLKATAVSLLEKTRRLRTVHFLPQYLPEAQKEHRMLLQALESGDGRKAERITRRHIERAGKLLSHFAKDLANNNHHSS